MRRFLLIPLLLLPLSAGAAAYPVATSSTATNTYTAASEITVAQPLPADLITAAGTVHVGAKVNGDILAAGGTLTVLEGAGGDVRVAGGRVDVVGTVGGDIAAAGGTVRINGTARNIYAAGASVEVTGASSGDVTIYGANVSLSGDYAGNVSIVASNRFTLGENTHIRGTLKYSAPEELIVPATTHIDGGTRYTGAYAYVPTNHQAHQYALLGTGIFFAVRVLAGMIVAGLIVGLFPIFAEAVADLALRRNVYSFLRLLILGLALVVLTPILCLLLLISFVGAELALLLLLMYIMLGLIAYAFCGISMGLWLRRTLLSRVRGDAEFTWRDAAIGTAVIHALALIPMIGTPLIILITLVCAGALAHVVYRESFGYY